MLNIDFFDGSFSKAISFHGNLKNERSEHSLSALGVVVNLFLYKKSGRLIIMNKNRSDFLCKDRLTTAQERIANALTAHFSNSREMRLRSFFFNKTPFIRTQYSHFFRHKKLYSYFCFAKKL